MAALGSAERPLRVAIVGSGPSGFYAADALLNSDVNVTVDLFDRLPTPYGLVRLGVAPDHQKIKSATRVFEKTASDPRLQFWGNVCVGKDVSVDELRTYYDAVLFSCGAETDRRLGIPGEDLPGSHTATAFVAWYNGHPDYRDMTFDLSCETAVVIGQGNVAIDVCRILAKTPDELKTTDIAQHALDALAESNIRHIYMVGRRGPAQAKFTLLEIKEMGKLEDCDPIVVPGDLELEDISQADLEKSKLMGKVYQVLHEFAERPAPTKSRQLHVEFRKSPVEITGNEKVEGIVLERNVMKGEAGNVWAEGTGETETLPCGLVFRSVGYRGLPLEGVPFDDRSGVFSNIAGRIVEQGTPVPGLYAAGWIKRGPSGVIGTNKPDAQATVKFILEDLPSLHPCVTPDSDVLREKLNAAGVRIVSFEDWKKLDAEEISRGEAVGKPREKFTRVSEMLDWLGTH